MAKSKKTASEPTLGYEAKLWQMADALRNNMDAAEYKHVVLGQREILTLLLADGFVTSASCVRALGIAKDTAWRDLSDLIEKEWVVRTGAGKASRYTPGPALDRLNRLIASDPRTNIGCSVALARPVLPSTTQAKQKKQRDLDDLDEQPEAATAAPDESDE